MAFHCHIFFALFPSFFHHVHRFHTSQSKDVPL
jgi:hypothetical protein